MGARTSRYLALLAILAASGPAAAEPLPGTASLTADGDLAAQMVDGIDRFLLRKTAESVEMRQAHWKRDTSSPAAYGTSVVPNRRQLARILGVADPRVPFDAPEILATLGQSIQVGRGAGWEAYAVRWPAIGGPAGGDPAATTVYGEGLLFRPVGRRVVADVVAVPDADQTPEQIAGLAPGVPAGSQFARRLAEAGCRVMVPVLVSRDDALSMPPSGQRTNQPHREYVYRPAFQMGRHVIGYELQKVLAAVDWFARDAANADPRKSVVGPGEDAAPGGARRRVGVVGYGEGGLLALYAGALDERVDVTSVSGHFGPREGLWREPIYRNVQGLLATFGDAEVGSLICPRQLVVDKADGPLVEGPPTPRDGRKGAAPGRLMPIDPAAVGREVGRMNKLTDGLPPFAWVVNATDQGPVGDSMLSMVLHKLGGQLPEKDRAAAVEVLRPIGADAVAARQRRAVDQWI